MKRSFLILLLFIHTIIVYPQSDQKRAAANELNEGASLYKQRKYAEAQHHFEKALLIDPDNKNAPFFIARSIHAQYKPHLETTDNISIAHKAIEAYKRVLEKDPDNDEAYNAIAYLYGAIKEIDLQTDWIEQRALNTTISNPKRSQAFTILASRKWDCSYKITEDPNNKDSIVRDAMPTIVFKMPKDPVQYNQALQCANVGLELIEQAISLNSANKSAWSYKINLLKELAKLSSMKGLHDQARNFERLANEAWHISQELVEKRETSEDKEREGSKIDFSSTAKRKQEDQQQSSSSKISKISAGVLNGKAINKPALKYPEEAKIAGIEGTVTVTVELDETGKVITAKPISGHPLLHNAAVDAAYRTEFKPTTLKGKPVRVVGSLVYKFSLQR
jgi:TonB family protein